METEMELLGFALGFELARSLLAITDRLDSRREAGASLRSNSTAAGEGLDRGVSETGLLNRGTEVASPEEGSLE